jgi:hypothetical protein
MAVPQYHRRVILLRQIHDWLPTDDATEAYVLFNNVPRTKDIKRFRELGLDSSPDASRQEVVSL